MIETTYPYLIIEDKKFLLSSHTISLTDMAGIKFSSIILKVELPFHENIFEWIKKPSQQKTISIHHYVDKTEITRKIDFDNVHIHSYKEIYTKDSYDGRNHYMEIEFKAENIK